MYEAPELKPSRRKRRRNPEQVLHAAIATYLDYALPHHAMWFPVPNAGNIMAHRGKVMKRTGEIKAGAPDIIVIHAGRCIGIELKAPEGGGLKDAQKAFRDRMKICGSPYFMIRSLDQMEAALKELDIPIKARL